MQKLRLLIFIAIHLVVSNSFSQSPKIDSLRAIVTNYSKSNSEYKKDTIYINHLIELSNSFQYVKLDSMFNYGILSKNLSESMGYTNGLIKSENNIGNYYMLKGEYDKARAIHSKNLKFSKISGRHDITARIYNSIVYIYVRKSNYPKAYEICLEGLDFAIEHKDYTNAIRLNMNIGVLFSLLKDFKNSLRYFNDCLKYQEIYSANSDLGMVQANMGYSYLYLKKYKKGLHHLNEALEVFKKSQIPEWKAFTYITMGKIYFEQRNLEKAHEFFKLAEIEHEKIEDKKGTIDMKIGLAKTYFLMNKIDLSEQYAQKVEILAKEHQYLEGLLGALEILYQLNKKKNEWEKSLVYLEETRKLADSIAFEENKNILLMDEARINYEREKENIKYLSDKAIAKQKQYVIWALIGLLMAVCAALVIFRSNRMAKHLNRKLAEQTQTLSESKSTLNQINKNQEKLFSIVGHDLRGPIVSLKELVGLSLENDSGKDYFFRFAPKLKKDLDHIHFMLDNLLNWGQTQMMGATLNAGKINVRDEIETIHELCKKKISAKFITFQNDLESGSEVLVDLNHFSIIFRNLISNAIKFTPENGTIWISAKKADNKLTILVKDNGIGMNKEVLKKIVNNPEHYTTFGTNNERGTGLGLLLCQEMVEKNHGTIQVESETGKGSTFKVSFPTSI